jgi:hypothetical protein
MFGAILGAAAPLIGGLFAGRREDNRFQLSREDAIAAEKRQWEYNRIATADQRAFDVARYGVERRDALFDYRMQRADASADYQRMRGDARADYRMQRADGAADFENQFVNLRAAAEKGGFNPLAVLGLGASSGSPGMASVSMGSPSMASVSGRSGVPLVPAAQSIGYVPPTDYMGSAIAEAGLALSDSFMQAESLQNAGKLEASRERLRRTKEAMQRDTIRPKVGGVYAEREQMPSRAQALGRNDGDRHGSPSFEARGRGYRPNADHPLTGSLGDIAVPDPTLDRGSGLFGGGFRLEGPPGWSNGQQLENELGEIGSVFPQIAYGGAYIGHNAARLYDYASRRDKRRPRTRKSQSGFHYNPYGLPGYDNLTGSRPSERFR